MALRSSWWWTHYDPTNHIQTQPSSIQLHEPYQGWPWNTKGGAFNYGTLEKILRERKGLRCRVDQLTYHSNRHRTVSLLLPSASEISHPEWIYRETATTVADLKVLLTHPLPDNVHSVIYVVNYLESEAMQALGHYLDIPPGFFNRPWVQLRTGTRTEQCVYFSLQIMELYQPGTYPLEALQSETSPCRRFRAATGGYKPLEWHVTCVQLIFLKRTKETVQGLIQVDPLDETIAEGIKRLTTGGQVVTPGQAEEYAGLGRVLSAVIYMVTHNWSVFLDEAETHLHVLGEKCLNKSFTTTEQLQYTRELHSLLPLWVQVRRRLAAAKDLIAQIIEHPFFISVGGYNARITLEGYLGTQIMLVDDHISRCDGLADQTKSLISLIFNIATLQDTKVAVEESKAANAIAGSIRRVTMLTFVYLPLTLASSVLGMNVSQITGDGAHTPLWAYFVTAGALMLATFGGWFVWSGMTSRMKWRARRKA